jgi:hypothetical protein
VCSAAPLNPGYSASEFDFALRHLNVGAVIVSPRRHPRFAKR